MGFDADELLGSMVDTHCHVQNDTSDDPLQTEELVCVPDVEGLSIARAASLLRQRGLDMTIEGTGFAIRQEPAAGQYVEQGGVVRVVFEMPNP